MIHGRRKILILGTGGTIAGLASDDASRGYVAGALSLADLVRPTLAAASLDVELDEVAQIDSKDMGESCLRALALRASYWTGQDDVSAVLITHGTDTLEESAYFLHAVLPTRKPVVFVSAMRPANDPWPDGPQNLADALTLAQAPGAAGVMAVAAGKIHSGRDVRKVHPTRLDAFGSGDSGCLGYVEGGEVRMVRPWPVAVDDLVPGAMERLQRDDAGWPQVALVFSHAAARADLPVLLARSGYAGIVVAGTGNASLHESLVQGLEEAERMGTRVIVTSRCGEGPARFTGRWSDPVITPLPPVKARIALQLRLMMAGRGATGS